MSATCALCPHHCSLKEGQKGLCKARICLNGEIISESYGKLTALALDPVEKKPLKRFHPGKKLLSIGSYGCNLRCPFCQNAAIAASKGDDLPITQMQPFELVDLACTLKEQGNIGIAYTYNEPLVGYEYVSDCAKMAHAHGLYNVVVTNGYICLEPLKELLAHIDALNIDLKGFIESYYKELGGDLKTVKASIAAVARVCHVEVSTLIVPGKNDSETEINALSAWLASVRPDIPLHILRFFPSYKMQNSAPTPIATIYKLAELARKHLKYVYEGNC